MGSKVGYPKYIEDPEALAAEYREVKLKANITTVNKIRLAQLKLSDGNFLQNMLTLKKHEVWKELRKLTRPVDKAKWVYIKLAPNTSQLMTANDAFFFREWLIQPLTVNAFHNPTTNEISKIS
jgi:predicted metalloendopeptidase